MEELQLPVLEQAELAPYPKVLLALTHILVGGGKNWVITQFFLVGGHL
jgi:hypothetical protein